MDAGTTGTPKNPAAGAGAGATGLPTAAAGNPTAGAGAAGLEVVNTAIDVVRDIDRAVRYVRGRRVDLVDQLQRAAESMALNLAEGAGRAGRDKAYHYRVAYASAGEAGTALRLLHAYGALTERLANDLLGRLDQVRAITWRLAH